MHEDVKFIVEALFPNQANDVLLLADFSVLKVRETSVPRWFRNIYFYKHGRQFDQHSCECGTFQKMPCFGSKTVAEQHAADLSLNMLDTEEGWYILTPKR